MGEPEFITVTGRQIAMLRRAGSLPGLVWLGGFRSEMTATKASHIDAFAARQGFACTRFDYSGHGQSEGRFEELVISDWLADALAVIKERTGGPQILIGSSMGGWIALLAAEQVIKSGQADRVAGLVLVAPAPDFTERLMWDQFPPEMRRQIETEGVWHRASAYAPEPTPITRALIEDGRKHLVLERGLDLKLPVHILHGTADPDVPHSLSLELAGRLRGSAVTLTLVKDGDHRLSTPADLSALETAIATMISRL